MQRTRAARRSAFFWRSLARIFCFSHSSSFTSSALKGHCEGIPGSLAGLGFLPALTCASTPQAQLAARQVPLQVVRLQRGQLTLLQPAVRRHAGVGRSRTCLRSSFAFFLWCSFTFFITLYFCLSVWRLDLLFLLFFGMAA